MVFYAPWCPHCKGMMPFWEELATSYKDRADLVIAKCDAIAETWAKAEYSVPSFPTLLWFAKDGKMDPRAYEGSRAVLEMSQFVDSGGKMPGQDYEPEQVSPSSQGRYYSAIVWQISF